MEAADFKSLIGLSKKEAEKFCEECLIEKKIQDYRVFSVAESLPAGYSFSRLTVGLNRDDKVCFVNFG